MLLLQPETQQTWNGAAETHPLHRLVYLARRRYTQNRKGKYGMFPHLRTIVHELFANERRRQAFLTDPEGLLGGMSLSAEERGALLRLHGRLSSMAETGALLVNPAGIWP